MFSVEFLNAVVRGIESGAIYALFALGLVVVFQTTGVFNFAHGELFMAGGVLGVVLWQSFGIPLVGALVLTVLACAVAGALTERVAVRPALRFKHSEAWLLSTLGVSLLIANAFALAIVRDGDIGVRPFPRILSLQRVYRIGDVIIETDRAFVVVVALLVALGLSLFMRRTQHGRALRAVAADREGAALRGLPVHRLGMMSFAIGGGIGALGGFVAAPVTKASVYVGLALLLKGFIAGALGGFSHISGAIVGGLVLGLAEQMTAVYTDGRLDELFTLALLLIVLSLRPHGLIGSRARLV
jgi:branched-chain amino acid transport system permease protein